MNKFVKYSFVAIGLYLAVAYASGSEGIIKTGFNSGSNLVKAFQGR